MIKLHGFGPKLGLADASPFVLKVDAYLRLAGIPFERRSGVENIRRAPKGKLPFISDDGQVISDSSFIIRHLEQKYKPGLDDHLSDQQKAVAFLLRSTLEEKLYWCTLYFRWVDDAGWAQVKPLFFGDLPLPLKAFLPALVRRDTRSAVYKQGTGRHAPEEILTIAREIMSNISTLLGDGPWLFGDKPCSTDATLYGFLAQTTLATLESPINTLSREFPKLCNYCENFRNTYYSEE